MAFEEKITLIDAMIREDPECTIKDYLELVRDIEAIENMNGIFKR